MLNVPFKQRTLLYSAIVAVLFLNVDGNAMGQTASENSKSPIILPKLQQPYTGTLGHTPAESSPPKYSPEVQAPAGAPNVLLIMTDDVGFGASSTFGGPIPTPTFDTLAAHGLRYNRFHTTALCSPTRAALLTGRNHHSVGVGIIPELATGYPGYTSVIPKTAATIAETLRLNGYSTAMLGKNHNVPDWQNSPSGPFDNWPNALGFEYFYGFNGGATNQWAPALVENRNMVEPPVNDPTYILDHDLADHGVSWLRMHQTQAPVKPFLMYYAPGSSHAPHQAPKEWIAKFKGQFDQGWDKLREETFARQKKMGVIPKNAELTTRPPEIPAWDSLTADQKKVAARLMEVNAAALAYSDDQIGRV
ncbi:MAG: sulfatase-like hydrolase/transferase, partial [Gammaproteobacteria bacterium]